MKMNARERPGIIVFNDANSRETFFGIHNVRNALAIARGTGVKVGILDWTFGYDAHRSLYAGGEDFLNDPHTFREVSEHGYWMAVVLHETAPEAEIYALNTMSPDENIKAKAMIAAIDWAIANRLDVLTYSSSRFTPENEKLLNQAIEKAAAHGIVTTFIHCPNPNNLLPSGLFADADEAYTGRRADVQIFHYDYNILMVDKYLASTKRTEPPRSGDEIPFFSISSTSPITAGFVALMKSVNHDLNPADCKQILVESSRPLAYQGQACQTVPDACAAVKRALAAASQSK